MSRLCSREMRIFERCDERRFCRLSAADLGQQNLEASLSFFSITDSLSFLYFSADLHFYILSWCLASPPCNKRIRTPR